MNSALLITRILAEPSFVLLAIGAALLSFTLHEFSHALTATLLGDPTAKEERRLSLNPFRHLDIVGFVMLLVSGLGWAKPVPYNPYALKTRFGGNLLIPLAGPAMNFIQSIIAAGALKALFRASYPPEHLLVQFFGLFLMINLLLGFFNLIPIPPLDGSKALLDALSHPRYDHIRFLLETRGPLLLLVLVLLDMLLPFSLFGGLFSGALSFVYNVLFSFT